MSALNEVGMSDLSIEYYIMPQAQVLDYCSSVYDLNSLINAQKNTEQAIEVISICAIT